MKIETQLLFPTLCWTTLFDDREPFNAMMLQLAREMRERDPVGVEKTNVKGWQSPNILQNLDAFKEMNHRILTVCQRVGQSLHFQQNLIWEHQAWLNISPPGASNKLHHHSNCYFSGVYYVSLKAPECGSIYFRDPRVASRMLTYPIDQENDFTAGELDMRPEEGRMYIFPSWLEHGVESNESDEDRISIAFNVLARPDPSRTE